MHTDLFLLGTDLASPTPGRSLHLDCGNGSQPEYPEHYWGHCHVDITGHSPMEPAYVQGPKGSGGRNLPGWVIVRSLPDPEPVLSVNVLLQRSRSRNRPRVYGPQARNRFHMYVVVSPSQLSNPTCTKANGDRPGDDADLVIWTAIEPAVGILCACFPVIAPAFSRTIIKTRFGSFGGGSAGSLLRRVWRSKGSRGSGGGGGGKSDDTVPLSFVSSSYSNNKTKAYVNTTEKKTHPFTQLSDVTDKDTRFVTPSNGSNGSSPTHPRKGSVPDYKIEGVLPTQTLRDKLDP